MKSTENQNIHGWIIRLQVHKKGEDGEALERHGMYKKERWAEEGRQILLDRQTKERTFVQDLIARIQSESGNKKTEHPGRDGGHLNLGNLLVSQSWSRKKDEGLTLIDMGLRSVLKMCQNPYLDLGGIPIIHCMSIWAARYGCVVFNVHSCTLNP